MIGMCARSVVVPALVPPFTESVNVGLVQPDRSAFRRGDDLAIHRRHGDRRGDGDVEVGRV